MDVPGEASWKSQMSGPTKPAKAAVRWHPRDLDSATSLREGMGSPSGPFLSIAPAQKHELELAECSAGVIDKSEARPMPSATTSAESPTRDYTDG